MISMLKKQKYLSLRLDNQLSSRQAAKLTGISRTTGDKYWKEYLELQNKILRSNDIVETTALSLDAVDPPSYNSSTRKNRKFTDDVEQLVDRILAQEEIKTEQLGSRHKQAITAVQIYEQVKAEGYDVSLSTITKKVKSKRKKPGECFIPQTYDPGERFEYDFGEVKLMIGQKHTRLYLAVITLPYSKYRWARLYKDQKMSAFLDSHIRFFEEIGGGLKEGVYDNMRNVVTKFLGHNQKQLNPQLLELARYYGFKVNVTNAFSGNEKGSVERSVEVIRNRAFAREYSFHSVEEAQEHLEYSLEKINKKAKLEIERKFLTHYRLPFETAVYEERTVTKCAIIQIETNQYSVPDSLIGQKVLLKMYPDRILVLHDQQIVASHPRIKDKKKTCLDIRHYLDTLEKKPGALKNSIALKSCPELHLLFMNYFSAIPKKFIEILSENRDLPLEELPEAVRSRVEGTGKTEDDPLGRLCDQQLQAVSSLFMSGGHI